MLMKTSQGQRTNLFIDPALWRALRVRAIEEGTTATNLLNRIIDEYLLRHPSATRTPRTAKQAAR
jgi:hypothetical protein